MRVPPVSTRGRELYQVDPKALATVKRFHGAQMTVEGEGSVQPMDGSGRSDAPQGVHRETVVAVLWFPPGVFEQALQRWPTLREELGEDTYAGYVRLLEGTMRRALEAGMRNLHLHPVDLSAYLAWCAAEDLEPGHTETRSEYASVMAARGRIAPWPPGRDDACWCRSGKKYRNCCGGV